MGYESLEIDAAGLTLQVRHNDSVSLIKIVDGDGDHAIHLTRAQAQQLKRHLNSALPIDFDHD